MSTVGLLIDPEFGTGIGGAPGAAVRCHVSSRQKRIFDKDELKGVHTHVELFLPFSMHGFTGTYRSSSQLSLALTIVEWPPHIAAAHLGLIPQDVNHLSLTPDTWGHVNYTRAELIHANFEPIEPHVSADREDHYRRILRTCTREINPLLDWYSLVSGNYAVQRVSAQDFARFRVWHSLPPAPERYNDTKIYFPEASLGFSPPESEGDLALMQKAVAYERLAVEFKLAYKLYVEAWRAWTDDDARQAAISGQTSLEVALARFIKDRIRNDRDEDGQRRISMNRYDLMEKEITFSIMLNALLPLVWPRTVRYPKELVEQCDKLRRARNFAIHEPVKFDARAIPAGLQAVGNLLGLLEAHIGSPSVTRDPGLNDGT